MKIPIYLSLFMVWTPHSCVGKPLHWQGLAQAPPQLIQFFANDRTAIIAPKVEKARFIKVSLNNGVLYLVDTNNIDNCGSAGCQLLGYLQVGNSYRNVLGVLTDTRQPPPALPNNFVSITKTIKHGLPCLNFPGKPITQWCFNGKEYNFVRTLP